MPYVVGIKGNRKLLVKDIDIIVYYFPDSAGYYRFMPIAIMRIIRHFTKECPSNIEMVNFYFLSLLDFN